MSELVLEFHNWRRMKSDDDRDPIALFHFSLLPADRFDRGERPTHEECFWCESGLSRDLAERDGWKDLNREQKIRILFHHAVESIQNGKRMLRQAPLVWRPGTGLEKGPRVAPSSIPFPRMLPMRIDAATDSATLCATRAGAGL